MNAFSLVRILAFRGLTWRESLLIFPDKRVLPMQILIVPLESRGSRWKARQCVGRISRNCKSKFFVIVIVEVIYNKICNIVYLMFFFFFFYIHS